MSDDQSSINLHNVSLEEMLKFQQEAIQTATNVFNCAIQSQSKVCTFHGPSCEHENKEKFPYVLSPAKSLGNDFFIPKDEVLHINPNKDGMSFIFSGLVNNMVIIHGKINHVLIRRSSNVNLDIKEGTISGVDIVHCKQMLIKMPYHNFTNLEFGEGICFQAEINDVSQLHITGSLDVKVNGTAIHINPFMNAIFSKNGWCYKKQTEIPKLMLCKY